MNLLQGIRAISLSDTFPKAVEHGVVFAQSGLQQQK